VLVVIEPLISLSGDSWLTQAQSSCSPWGNPGASQLPEGTRSHSAEHSRLCACQRPSASTHQAWAASSRSRIPALTRDCLHSTSDGPWPLAAAAAAAASWTAAGRSRPAAPSVAAARSQTAARPRTPALERRGRGMRSASGPAACSLRPHRRLITTQHAAAGTTKRPGVCLQRYEQSISEITHAAEE
jgi:hypothetical protein